MNSSLALGGDSGKELCQLCSPLPKKRQCEGSEQPGDQMPGLSPYSVPEDQGESTQLNKPQFPHVLCK